MQLLESLLHNSLASPWVSAVLKQDPRLPALLLVLRQEPAVALSGEPSRIVPAHEWMLGQ